MAKNFEAAKLLINQRINETLKMYAQDEHGKDYLIRHCDHESDNELVIQPTYSTEFYGIIDYIKIVDTCGCHVYVSVETNLAGVLTPTLHIHY